MRGRKLQGELGGHSEAPDRGVESQKRAYVMTPRQRRYMGTLWLSVALAIAAALTAGWVALAFGVGSVVVLVAAGRRRLRQCWREGI